MEFIKNPKEREEYLKQDVWDMRRLFKDYPKHNDPRAFIVKFTNIENVILEINNKKILYKYAWVTGNHRHSVQI